jgi:hypothetical protein
MPMLRRLTTALLLLFCLAPLGKPLGMVLCLGADGHIALEPVHDRAHRTAAPTRAGLLHQLAAGVLGGGDRTDLCVDVTFLASESGTQLIPASGTCQKSEVQACVPVLVIVPASLEYPVPPLLSDGALWRHRHLTVLRSVVLHI